MHKITLYRFNQGANILLGGSNGSRGLSPSSPPHFNHCYAVKLLQVPRKISYTFHNWHESSILDDVKLAELFNNGFE